MQNVRINWSVIWSWFIGVLVVGAIGWGFWLLVSIHKIEIHELGFAFNKFTGQIETFDHTGWVKRNPISYDVHKIDLRPRQVSINANSRVLNAKLVRFNPAGLETFIKWHGREAGDQDEKMYEILRSYAFDVNGGTDCPFLIIDNELERQTRTTPLPEKK